PTGDIFSNRMIWFEDSLISAELVQMRTLAPEQWVKPLPMTADTNPILNAKHDGHVWRRVPEPLRLLSGNEESASS
ncbi:TPA: cellulose biosynthesis protein BcsE, partial [Enterobacter soli]|nr:cellulose biosynthesis protein BcsE [Enterobacter soli]